MQWRVGTQIKMIRTEKELEGKVLRLNRKNLLKHNLRVALTQIDKYAF